MAIFINRYLYSKYFYNSYFYQECFRNILIVSLQMYNGINTVRILVVLLLQLESANTPSQKIKCVDWQRASRGRSLTPGTTHAPNTEALLI